MVHEDLKHVKENVLGVENPPLTLFPVYLRVLIDEGLGDLAPNSNGLWKEWNPTSVKDVVSKLP